MMRHFSLQFLCSLSLSFLMSCSLRAEDNHLPPIEPIDFEVLEQSLKTEGLVGYVHGAVEASGVFVFSWQDPDNFFRRANFPLVSEVKEVKETLKTLQRHDKIKIKGEFIDNEAPQKHIEVSSLEVVKEHPSEFPLKEGIAFPEELKTKTSLIGKVHIVAGDGKILVIDYKDAVIPVYVADPKYTEGLARHDKIKLSYKLRRWPKRPQHLQLDVEAEEPLVHLHSLMDDHYRSGVAEDTLDEDIPFISLEGYLVRFPKSPQVRFDVYALRKYDEDYVAVNYTLINFEDSELFKAIREKAEAVWKANEESFEYARNKWINKKILVKAQGHINMVDPGQANPQILIYSLDDLSFELIEQSKD